MKKLLMVLAVVCIPQVVTADTPSYVEGKRAIEIIEQGTIIEMRLERLTSEFLKKFTVLFKGNGYQCGVRINNDSIGIASRCLKLKLEDYR